VGAVKSRWLQQARIVTECENKEMHIQFWRRNLLKSGYLEEEEGDGRHKKWMFVFEGMQMESGLSILCIGRLWCLQW
jgi:hypothetical protein